MWRNRENRPGAQAAEYVTTHAMTDAVTTGMKLRGRHSKSRSSTASNVAAIGEAKTADIPPAAPATSNVFRSAALKWKSCARIEPKAPAGHDNGTFRAKRTACSDRDSRRDRLRVALPWVESQLPPEKNRFQSFRNSVSADFFRAISRHQTDHERAGHRRGDDPRPEVVMLQ